MTTLTLRLNKEEEQIFNSISGLYGGKLSTTIKQLALEKIEDEYDLQLIKDFESREEKGVWWFKERVWSVMYKIVFDDAIKKDLKRLDKQTLKILFNWIEKNLSNIDDPRSKGKALVGNKKGYWRYRIGDYRLITRIEDDRLIIIAINFKHRREVYN